MFLSDATIRKYSDPKQVQLGKGLLIHPFHEKQLQPASYDVTLGKGFKKIYATSSPFQLTKSQIEPWFYKDYEGDCCLLDPNELVLATTEEVVNIPDFLRCSIEGKSSLARLGILVHISAGYIDPGFSGRVTLEIVNLSPRTYVLEAGMRIAQLAFSTLDRPCEKPYGQCGNHYQHQTTVEGSKWNQEVSRG